MKFLTFSFWILICSFSHAGRFGHIVPDEANSLETFLRDAQEQDPKVLHKAIIWNVYKGGKDALASEYKNLAKESDFVLLQEVTNHLKDTICLKKTDCYFSTAFQYKETAFGLATVSKHPAFEAISLQSDEVEPILLTPKNSLITKYELNGSPITIVNTHGINFVGLAAFKVQIREVSEYLWKVQGPIIWAGDFNTWNFQRINFLKEITNLYEMDEVAFDNKDCIKTFMGHNLDRAFTRNIKVKSAKCQKRKGSDHNPLILEFLTAPL